MSPITKMQPSGTSNRSFSLVVMPLTGRYSSSSFSPLIYTKPPSKVMASPGRPMTRFTSTLPSSSSQNVTMLPRAGTGSPTT